MLKAIYTRTKQHLSLRNHNSTALERSVLDDWGVGGGGLKLVLLDSNGSLSCKSSLFVKDNICLIKKYLLVIHTLLCASEIMEMEKKYSGKQGHEKLEI